MKTQSADFIIEAGALKEYHGASADVVIPDNVTEISGGAFGGMSVASVTLPEGLKKISGAFCDCDSLKTINLPEGLKEISHSFDSCDSLQTINLPEGLKEISYSFFFGCKSLKSITLPNTLEILKRSFGYSGLERVTIPSGISMIGSNDYQDGCFSGCDSLKEVVIEEGVSCIGADCFSNCPSLEEITIPASVKEIGDFAFQECKNLSNVIILGSNTKVGMSAFRDCPSLVSVTASASVLKGILRDYGKREWKPFYNTPWYDSKRKEECRALGICEDCGRSVRGAFIKKCSHCGRKH